MDDGLVLYVIFQFHNKFNIIISSIASVVIILQEVSNYFINLLVSFSSLKYKSITSYYAYTNKLKENSV